MPPAAVGSTTARDLSLVAAGMAAAWWLNSLLENNGDRIFNCKLWIATGRAPKDVVTMHETAVRHLLEPWAMLGEGGTPSEACTLYGFEACQQSPEAWSTFCAMVQYVHDLHEIAPSGDQADVAGEQAEEMDYTKEIN